MTPLIFASAMALFHATLSSSDPLFPTDGPGGGPVPVNGIWAGLPADCEIPSSLDLSTWPKCATPVGFLDGVIAVLQKPAPGAPAAPDQYASIARTKFWVVKGAPADTAPAIVQVDIPILFASSTIYIAIKPDAVDDAGMFVSARGWPVGCPGTALSGIVQNGARCTASTVDGVRAAAALEPEPSKIYRLVRIKASEPSEEAPTLSDMPPAASTPSTPPTSTPGVVTQTPLDAPAPGPGAPPPPADQRPS